MKKYSLLILGISFFTLNAWAESGTLPHQCSRTLPCQGYYGGCAVSSDSWVQCGYLKNDSGKVWGAFCKAKGRDGRTIDRVATCKETSEADAVFQTENLSGENEK